MTENTATMKPTLLAEPVRSARRGVDGGGWTGLVLVAALVAMTLVAGLIFTFSVAVMPNLAGTDDRTFAVIMQRFNQNPVFPLTFTGALVLTALAAALRRRHGPEAATRWTIAALVLYGLVVAVTAAIHIPLNGQFDQTNPDRVAELADVRNDTEGPWVAWNVVRTLLSTSAVAALARALLLHGCSTADSKAGAGASPLAWPPPSGGQT